MSKKTQENSENIGDIARAPLHIHRQYIKDLSFENPSAPAIFETMKQRPVMDMNVGIDVQRIEHEEHKHFYEVTLQLNASAVKKDNPMFIIDLDYAAAVSIDGLDEANHHPLLFVEIPHLIYPYARQIVAQTTQAGAYMPLQLSPVDFKSMYFKRFGKNNENAKKPANEGEKTKKAPAKKPKTAKK